MLGMFLSQKVHSFVTSGNCGWSVLTERRWLRAPFLGISLVRLTTLVD
jgi:hypothetical protein